MRHEHATHLTQSMLIPKMRRTSQPCAGTLLQLLENGPSNFSAIFSWSRHQYKHNALFSLSWRRINNYSSINHCSPSMGKDFLRYINKENTHWEANLGTLYGTEYWQLDNNKQQNRMFKSELVLTMSKFYMKKRLVGLSPEILACKIVLVVQNAILNLFMNIQHSQSALLHRGWNPFNRNSLDCPQILKTAPETVHKERDTILWSRGITLNASTRNVLYSWRCRCHSMNCQHCK